jgi:hypothetical protein
VRHRKQRRSGNRTPSVATAPRGPGLTSALSRAEDGLPHFAFIPVHAHHHCALQLSTTEAPLAPATFVHNLDPTLTPQAPPSPHGACHPQPLPRPPVTSSKQWRRRVLSKLRRLPPRASMTPAHAGPPPASSTPSRAPRERQTSSHLNTRPPTTAGRPLHAVRLRPTTPHRGAHSSVGNLPVPTPQMGAPRCGATLARLPYRPCCRQAGAGRATTNAAVDDRPSPVLVMGQKG